MPLAFAKALVLGAEPFKEQDKLVYLLTPSNGVLKAVAPGALKHNNRFGSLLELFCEGEFYYYWKEDHEWVTLSKADLAASFFHIVSQPGHIFYFYFIAETLRRFSPCPHPDQRVYRLARAILESCAEGGEARRLSVYFLIWMLRIEGLMFNPRQCQNCSSAVREGAWLRADFRGILCHRCRTAEKWRLETPELEFILQAQRTPPRDLRDYPHPVDFSKLFRIFKLKLEHHGELELQTARYLPEFQ